MTDGAALLALAAAMVAWPATGAVVTQRARRLTPSVRAAVQRRAPSPAWQRHLLAGAVGCALGLLVGGVPGVVVAVGGGRLTDHLLRRAAPGGSDLSAARLRELPIACELVAVCLAAGSPVGTALAAVAEAVRPPLADALREVAGLHRLGAEPRRAWEAAPEDVAALGRVLVRAGESGSAAGPALRVLAADVRAASRARTDRDVRRAGVWVLAPLGLCFLPAFLCLGVVPLVLGIAGDVFR